MFGAKCKEHPEVELEREYPREGNGKFVEYCPKCRENSPLNKFFNASVLCAECKFVKCPLREFGLEFKLGCYEGKK